jgi:hypothetical protein
MKLKFNRSIFHNDILIKENEIVELSGLEAMLYVNSGTASIFTESETIQIENRELSITKKVTKRTK